MYFIDAMIKARKGAQITPSSGDCKGTIYQIIKDSLYYLEDDKWLITHPFGWIWDEKWEVVDKDKDWNLQSALVYNTGFHHESDVRKCRDLILKDIKKEQQFERNTYQWKLFIEDSKEKIEEVAYRRCIHHIKERFGDM